MADFMFLFRGSQTQAQPSPEEMQKHMQEWMVWIEKLRKAGTFKAGDPLEGGGKVVSGTRKLVTDGPFAESKEVVGGYLLVTAKNLDDAVEISKECPIFAHGGSVEVRPVQPMHM
jgi:hypothetical protein